MKYFTLLILLISVCLVSGCTEDQKTGSVVLNSDIDVPEQQASEESQPMASEIQTISEDCEVLNSEEFRGKVVMLYTKYCPHCKKTLPVIQSLEKESDLEFIYLDISEKENAEKAKTLGISTKYVPCVIINGYAFVGEKDKKVYEDALN